MQRLVLFTNILTPYRSVFYDSIHEYCSKHEIDFHVIVMSRTESNRNWFYEDFERPYTLLLEGKRINVAGYSINISKGLERTIKQLNPDFIISAGSYVHPTLWNLIRIAKKMGIPIFFWSETHLKTVRNFGKIKIVIRELLRKIIYHKFDGFFYAGSLSKQFIEKYCRPSSKLIFLPNLVDSVFYSTSVLDEENDKPLKEKYLLSNKRVFICPARLSNDKGILPFLELLKSAKLESNYVLLIAGDGELKNDIEEYATQNEIPAILLGFKSQSEMRELYQLADGFVLPSVVDPNPLTCIEALCSGLPLLVSDHVGNHPETIIEGENGFVFSYENRDQAIQKIEKFFLANDNWLKHASEISISIAQEKYDLKKQTKRICQEIINYTGA